MKPIIELAKLHNLQIVEDCCQAHGASCNNIKVPVTGLGVFSFYPGKNLGALGDGGAVVTNNLKLANLLRKLRNDGSIEKNHHLIIGNKSRLDSLQAAVLSVKLKRLSKWNNLRRRHAKLYSKLLNGIKEITLPHQANYARHVYHLYVIETSQRDQLQAYLKTKGISTQIHYPIPIHLQPAYRYLKLRVNSFPVAENKSQVILSLPIFPELTNKEINYISNQITNFFST